MTRIVLHGGRVFDGTGARPVAGRRRDRGRPDRRRSGRASTATRRSTSPGRTILPGFFDCHIHVCFSNVDLWGVVQEPFSLQFYEAAGEPPQDARDRDHLGPRRRRRGPRDPDGRSSAG